MEQLTIRLTDVGLFGNDAAEDEAEDVFRSYALETPLIRDFADPQLPLRIVRAYKGEGKSALLRLSYFTVSSTDDRPMVVVTKSAAELAPEFTSDDHSKCVRQWKAAIFGLLANEIGSSIGVAWTDGAMILVEEAERNGFKSRNFVSSVMDKLQNGVELGPVKIKTPEKVKASDGQLAGAVRRIAKSGHALWLFIDDLDKNFENTKSQKARLSAFFDAAREMMRAVPELRIRAAVRPNVWTTLKMEYESLSHVEQYVVDLKWSEEGCRDLLARRIEAYLKRHNQWTRISSRLPTSTPDGAKFLISTVFDNPMDWGGGIRPPHVVLYTLSKQRPRWLVELCKTAAAVAERNGHTRITLEDVQRDLTAFGDRRIQDTVAEFRSQCSEIDEVIQAFSRGPEELTTDELINVIERKILSHLSPRIAGVVGKPRALQIAAFLFEIGFFYGRRDLGDGRYEHISFSQKPTLLKARSNIDDGLIWEIHPVFRQALEMRDASGKELHKRSDGRRRRR